VSISLDSILAKASQDVRARNAAALHAESMRVAMRAAIFDHAAAPALAQSEKHLQEQIEGLLRRSGYFPIRQRMDRKSNIVIGCPDILFASRAGRAMAWEVKMPGQKPRPEQEQAMAAMAHAGWSVAVITSYDEVLGWVKADESFFKLVAE
jgi:hypothetical protein